MSEAGRILVVDDEAELRRTLARVFQRAGFAITTAGSGQEALAFLSQETFDLVYLDIRMPDMNGLEVLKAMQAQVPELPVVLFTAQPDLNSALEALRHGAVDYLLKPLQPQKLIERTQHILAERQKDFRRREIQMQLEALQAELRELEEGNGAPEEAGRKGVESSERFLTRGKLVLDLQAGRLTVNERPVGLAPTSFTYLRVLAQHAPKMVDYRTLVAEAQGYEADYREAQQLAKWHVHHIRQAIEPDARNPVFLVNVRGEGYRLVAD